MRPAAGRSVWFALEHEHPCGSPCPSRRGDGAPVGSLPYRQRSRIPQRVKWVWGRAEME
jgi:hypothetical protein